MTERMHILFVSTRSPYPLTGGHVLRTFHFLREAARRHYVSFLTFVQHEEEWDGLAVLREFCDNVTALPVPESGGIQLAMGLVSNLASPYPFVARKYNTAAMRQAIRAVRESAPVDLVHLDLLPLAVYSDQAGPAPVVLVDHNVEYILLERRAANETGIARHFWTEQARRLKRFEAAAVQRATRTIAVSDIDAGLLRSLAPGAEIRTVPSGVDASYFRPAAEPPDDNEIVFVGSLTHYPNLDSVKYFVEEIWPRIRAARPKAHFTVIGAHPPSSIRAFGTAPGVTVEGQVPDIRPYVGRAAVYVVPLRVGGGTRLKILDAMAMGKAIVSTTVGCEGLDVTAGSDLAVADEPNSFAATVLRLMDDQCGRSTMGIAARATVEASYGWDRLGEMQEAVHQEALASAGPGRTGAAKR